MITGITRPEEVAHLGLSNRLLARIGALLKKNLALSLAALESAKPGTPLEALFLRPEVLQEAAALSTESINKLAKDAGVVVALSVVENAGQRVLCLQEELEAAESWLVPARKNDSVEQLAARTQTPVPASSGVFGSEHLSRTRLKLATSANANERIEALRVIAFAPLSDAEKAEALLQGLSDLDASVRAEAALLLPGLGVSADAAAALADLNRGDSAKRLAAADRLDKLGAEISNELEEGAVIVCAMSALKTNQDSALQARLLALLHTRAGTLGRNPLRLGELLRAIVAIVAAAAKYGSTSRELDELSSPALKLVKELGRRFPEDMRPILWAELDRAPEFVSEAFMLIALFDLIPGGHADELLLLERAADYLARDTEEGRDSRAIGALMSRRGNSALAQLCAAFSDPSSGPGAKKHLLLLLDEMCRKTETTADDFARAAGVALTAMEEGSKALRMAAMECRFVSDARVPPAKRMQLAEAFLDSTSDFSFPFDIDKAESAVSRMGAPAVEPLLKRLGKERAPNERVRAARLLGELALNAKAEPGGFHALQAALTEALRRLEAASLEADFPERGEVLSALGKIISSPAASLEANEVVTRTLLDSARSSDPKIAARALEGAAYLAASRRASATLIAEVEKLLNEALEAPEPEQLESRSQSAAGETVFEILGGERYAIALPIVLHGLEHVALAPNSQAATTRRIGAMLLERWKELCRGVRIWGPANTYQVVQALRGIALSERCGPELRLEIVKGLLARHSQRPALHALTEILAHDDGPELSGVALDAGFAILARHDSEGRFDEVDRADILKALARLAQRKFLSAPSAETAQTPETFRRTVVNELLKGLKDNVAGAHQTLRELEKNEALPKALRDEIERRMKGRGELLFSRKGAKVFGERRKEQN